MRPCARIPARIASGHFTPLCTPCSDEIADLVRAWGTVVFPIRRIKNAMSTAGTLINKKRSGFVRTPPNLAVLIGKNILALPDEEFTVYDPTSGEGDFFYACAHARRARYFGSEISSERAVVARQRWPNATIVTSAFE